MQNHNIRTSIVLVLVLIFAGSLLADEPKTEPTKTTTTKDAFLSFALEKAQQYTAKGEEVMGKTVDMAMKEAPELAKEYLTWKFWYHSIHFGFGLIALGIIAIYLYGLYIGYRNNWDGDNYTMWMMFGSIVAFMALFVFGFSIGDLMAAIQIKIAPRIYILESIRDLVKH